MKKTVRAAVVLALAVLLIVCGKKIAQKRSRPNAAADGSIITVCLSEAVPSEAAFADGFGGFLRLPDFHSNGKNK